MMSAMFVRAFTSSTSACRMRPAISARSPRARRRRRPRSPGAQTPSDAASTSPTSRPCQAIACWSVRLATWSTMTRRRAASVSAAAKSCGVHRIERVGPLPQRRREALEHAALLLVEALAALDRDDHGADDALEHRHLGLDDPRHDHMRAVAGQHRRGVRLAGGRRRGAREAADEVGRQVLQPRDATRVCRRTSRSIPAAA